MFLIQWINQLCVDYENNYHMMRPALAFACVYTYNSVVGSSLDSSYMLHTGARSSVVHSFELGNHSQPHILRLQC